MTELTSKAILSGEQCDCCNTRAEFVNNEIYVGSKIIKAHPMDLVEFKNNKNEPYEGENMPGYRVEYEDGYISWSPKDTFERCYRLLSNKEIHMVRSFLL